jgi:hypothetical protein
MTHEVVEKSRKEFNEWTDKVYKDVRQKQEEAFECTRKKIKGYND